MIVAGVFTAIAVIIFVPAAILIRHRRWLRSLMDDGDGQGGIPHARLTISPQWERIAAEAARCPRCSGNDPRLPCSCPGDCYAVHCLAWAAPARSEP